MPWHLCLSSKFWSLACKVLQLPLSGGLEAAQYYHFSVVATVFTADIFLWRAAGKFPFSLCMIKVIFTEAEYPWILQVSFELIIFMIPRYLWSVSQLNQVHIAVYVFAKRILEKIYELFEIYPLEGLIQKDQFPFFYSDHCCEYTEHVTRLITDKNQQQFKGTYTFDCNSFQECHLRLAKQIS